MDDCSAPEDLHGLEALKSHYEASHNGFPYFQIHFDDMLVAENHIIFRCTVEGTQTGTLRGMPATGEYVCFPAVAIEVT